MAVIGDSAPVIVGCEIRSNAAVGLGGGVVFEIGSNPLIKDSAIYDNTAGDGGGISVSGATALVSGCSIHDNEAAFGGGIDLLSSTDVRIVDSDIAFNVASYAGAGFYSASSSSSLESCTITDNSSLGDGGACWFYESDARVERTSLLRNSAEGVAGGVFVSLSAVRITSGELCGNELAVHVEASTPDTVDARHNWWGDSSGPFHPDGNPAGLGDEVGDNVAFDPWNVTSDVGRATSLPELHSASPNPFQGCSTISLFLPESSRVRLSVVSAGGRLVRELLDGDCGAGHYSVAWDGRDERGLRAASGVYFVRLECPGTVLGRRIVVVR